MGWRRWRNGGTKFNINGNPNLGRIIDRKEEGQKTEIFYDETQMWLNQNYPISGTCLRKNEKTYWGGSIGINNFGKRREEIEELDISEQNLTGSLNLTGFSNLKKLDCSQNQLTSLDLSHCPNLTELRCERNNLTSLDLTSSPNLTWLVCYDNQLTYLILPRENKLTWLECQENPNLKSAFLLNINQRKMEWLGLDGDLKIQLELYLREGEALEWENVSWSDKYISLLSRWQLAQNLISQGFSPVEAQQWASLDFPHNQLTLIVGCKKNNFTPFETQQWLSWLDKINLQTDFISEILTYLHSQNYTPEKLESELIQQKRIFEGQIVEEKTNQFSNTIEWKTLLARWKRTNKKLLTDLVADKEKQKLADRVKTLEDQKKELEEQLKELEEERANLTKRNAYLELAIEESKYLIIQQKVQIVKVYDFTEEEEKACQELIKAHNRWFNTKKEKNYELAKKLNSELNNLRTKLEAKLGDKFNQTVEMILDSFYELYQRESDLQKQIKEKSDIEDHQANLEKSTTQTELSLDELTKAIKDKVEVVEEKIELNKKLITQTASLIQYRSDINYQITTEQNTRLAILEQQLGLSSSSVSQTLATHQLTETLNQTTSIQTNIQFSNQNQ